jgi:hypothetical protein
VDSCGERAASAQYPEVVKSTVRSLLSHMRVFAAFQDLKSAHRQAELREKVEGLLSHRLNQVGNFVFFSYTCRFGTGTGKNFECFF